MKTAFFDMRDGAPVAILALLIWAIYAVAAWAQPVAVDGDTIRDGATRYRLANIDAPETGSRARCEGEALLGRAATQRAARLLASGEAIVIEPTGRLDRYGRTLALVSVGGRDLGETLISEGLARPWRGRREDWCGQ